MSVAAPDQSRRTWAGLWMTTPAAVCLVLFVAVPFGLAIILSFTSYRLGSPLPTRWVGLEHYRRIFADGDLLQALGNNVVFAAVVVPLQTALAMGLAVLLDRPLRGIAAFRACFFLPVVYPMAMVSGVWMMLYAPGPDGPANRLLSWLSIGAWAPGAADGVLTSAATALPALMLMSIWQGVGFQTVILLAGMQGISPALYEAAALDGAGTWRRFRHITLPSLRGPLLFTALVTTILAFRLFDQVRIMTQGGPDGATTTVLFEAVRAAFDRQQIGLGSAITVVFFLIVLTLSVIQLRLSRRGGPR